MQINAYYEDLASHDWFYEYTDDYRVWAAGDANFKRLARVAETHGGRHRELFDEWCAYKFRQGPEPQRPMAPGICVNCD